MKTTKEEIIQISLKMFAERGFDSVSTAMIAEKIGITKGALYRHFESKQAIFDAIWDKMVELDAKRASEDNVPEKQYQEDSQSYQNKDPHDLCLFTINQFEFWTENEFASDFRRMITLEQFKSPEMTKLYQDVICCGPVKYTEELISEMIAEGKLNEEAEIMGAEKLAILLFAPLSLTIQMADGGTDKPTLKSYLCSLTKEFEKRWIKENENE